MSNLIASRDRCVYLLGMTFLSCLLLVPDILAAQTLCDYTESDQAVLQPEEQDNQRCFLFGLGVSHGSSTYLNDPEPSYFPLIYARFNRFYWHTNTAGFFIYGEENAKSGWGVSAQVTWPSDGFEYSYEAHLAQFDGREPSFEGGLGIFASAVWGELNFSVNFDLEDQHNGFTAVTNYAYPVSLGFLTFSPVISWKYRDKNNADYYFGLNSSHTDSAEQKLYFVTKPSHSLDVGYTVDYLYNGRVSFYHSSVLRFNDNVVNDSPLTINENVFSVTFGTMYRFY